MHKRGTARELLHAPGGRLLPGLQPRDLKSSLPHRTLHKDTGASHISASLLHGGHVAQNITSLACLGRCCLSGVWHEAARCQEHEFLLESLTCCMLLLSLLQSLFFLLQENSWLLGRLDTQNSCFTRRRSLDPKRVWVGTRKQDVAQRSSQ